VPQNFTNANGQEFPVTK